VSAARHYTGLTVHSPPLLEHFRNPRNVGDLPPPAVSVTVENPACGDIMRLSARIEDGMVTSARYQVRGCAASIGCGSALTDLLTGMAVAELARVDPTRVMAAVGGLEPESRHAAVLCADAVAALRGRLVGLTR